MRRLVGGFGYQPTIAPASVEFGWVGNVTTTGATVKVRSVDTPTLLYSTDPGLSGATAVGGTEGVDEVWTFNLSGLTANTTYYWSIVGWGTTGKVRTYPTSGNFSIAAASCAGHPGAGNAQYITGPAQTSDSPAFDRIRDRDPACFIHLGDLHYRDISTNNVSLYRTAYRDVLSNTRQHALYRQVPLAYLWDDHDYGPNNSDGTFVGKAAAQQAYREYVPHYSLPDSDAIYQQFVIGRVRFFVLDVRSERTPNSATDNSSKTMLGTTQKAWLKAQLSAATEPCLVIVSGSAWNSSLADGWGSFSTERAELAEHFEAESLTDKLIIVHGDIHALMADDGANTQYDSGSVNDGPPLVGLAPLDAGATTHSGTYNVQSPTLTTKQQYGTIDFADTGTQITATMKGWSVGGSPSFTETEVFSFSKVFSG